MKTLAKELERPEKEEFYSMYDWLIDQGIERGIEQGIEQGIERGRIETARNLYLQGVSIEVISKATKFSLAELEQILKGS